MSGHPNSHANSSRDWPPRAPWILPEAFASSSTSANGSGSGSSTSNRMADGITGGFLAPPGGRRYTSRTGNPYQTTVARRRATAIASGTREPRLRTEEGARDKDRRRVVVACTRCRRRKIRCSGDDGNGGSCTNCKNANEDQCLFLRVNANAVSVRAKEENNWPSFNYDMAACRQYQSRGSAVVSTMPGSVPTTAYAASQATITSPVNIYQTGAIMYNWGQGTTTAEGYNGEGSGASANGIGYGMYQQQPYHGIPSPETNYLGENDLMDRQAASMAETGAFALHNMANGLPSTTTSSSGGGHAAASHYGRHGSLSSTTMTPRSIPGPPSVLGSSRVPPSSVFSRSTSYPSPATTPIANGVSPVWSSYEQSPYTTMAAPAPSTMAAQSLERMPDLYSATPPPAAAASSASSPLSHRADSAVGAPQRQTSATSQAEGSMGSSGGSGNGSHHQFGYGSGGQ